jgi:glycolate oxidase
MHPLILFDANKPGDLEKCEAFGAEILKLCVEVGRLPHRRAWRGDREARPDDDAVRPDDLEAQMRVKDVFDPAWLLNPAKVFPLAVSEAAAGAPGRGGPRSPSWLSAPAPPKVFRAR